MLQLSKQQPPLGEELQMASEIDFLQILLKSRGSCTAARDCLSRTGMLYLDLYFTHTENVPYSCGSLYDMCVIE